MMRGVFTAVQSDLLGHWAKTFEDNEQLDDLVLAAKVKVALVRLAPDIEVTSSKGVIAVKTDTLNRQKEIEMRQIVEGLSEVKTLSISAKR